MARNSLQITAGGAEKLPRSNLTIAVTRSTFEMSLVDICNFTRRCIRLGDDQAICAHRVALLDRFIVGDSGLGDWAHIAMNATR
jgi:hypothetical protein